MNLQQVRFNAALYLRREFNKRGIGHKFFELEENKHLHAKYRNLVTLTNANGKRNSRLSIEGLAELASAVNIEMSLDITFNAA